MDNELSRTQIQALTDEELGAMVLSTKPSGRFWKQLAWACSEIARRARCKEKCKECGGTGEKFILPRGNPFSMPLPQLAQAMVKVNCFQCKGTGNAETLGEG